MHIRLCGQLTIDHCGEPLHDKLPGRQGRLLLAYLALKSGRPASRDELIDAVWEGRAPANPEGALRTTLSRVRAALPAGALEGRGQLSLKLGPQDRLDVQDAQTSLRDAQAAAARQDWESTERSAHLALEIARAPLMPGHEAPWLDEWRRTLEAVAVEALELRALAAVRRGGGDLAAAEVAARELVTREPYRESGYLRLMEVQAARNNVAEALRVYEELRRLLRDELGAAPGSAVKALHGRLLRGQAAVAAEGSTAAQETAVAPHPEEERQERKLVTVLSAELALPGDRQRLDAEDVSAELARRQAGLQQHVERLGGRMGPVFGTSVVATFGAPLAHEDDPGRALRVAVRACELGIVESAGVASGEAIVAPRDEQPLTTGQVVSTAVELQRLAPSGVVLVDEATFDATQATVSFERLPGLPPAWRPRAAHTPPTVSAEHPHRTRFIGRTHELALLEHLYHTVQDEGRPRLVAIVGDAGVGKTRLTDEFIKRVSSTTGAAIYRGRCLAYGEGVTYWPLREVLWAAAGIALGDGRATAGAKLGVMVEGLLSHVEGASPAECDRVTFALAVTAGISLPDNPLEAMSPESIAEEIGLAWPRLMSCLAAQAPTVLVLEDLHWAERPLVDMVERMLPRVLGPLLVVATARPDSAQPGLRVSASAGISQVGLQPLTERQTRELLRELLPRAAPELRERVIGPAEGNPFFAQEIAYHLAESGAQPGVKIPRTVRSVLTARIDGLPDPEKRTLQDAAVVGRVFWETTLESMRGGSCRDELRSLEARSLVAARPSSGLPGQTELSFSHALTREVAYQSIPRADRCRAHADVGVWLEDLVGDRREEFTELLAYHFEAAAIPADAALAWPADARKRESVRAKAVRALIDAGDAARKRAATDQALRFADRAQRLAGDDRERLGALELRARAAHDALHGDVALPAYLEAITLARTIPDREAISMLRGHATLLCTRYIGAFSKGGWKENAIRLVEEGLADTGEDAVTFERAALLLGRSWGMLRWLGPAGHDPAAAKQDAQRAVEIAKAIDSPYLLSNTLEGLTWLAFEEGFREAGAIGEQLRQAAAKTVDRVEAHESLVVSAICFARAGNFEAARAVADEATRQGGRLNPLRALHAGAAQTLARAPTGRMVELKQATGDVVRLAEEEGDRTCATGIVALAGRVLSLFETDEQAATARALEVLDRLIPVPRAADRMHSRVIVAELLRPVIGLARVRELLDPVEGMWDLGWVVLRLRAELPMLVLSSDGASLDASVDEARAVAARAGAPALAWIADWAEATLAIRRGDPTAGLARARAAAESLDAYGERYTAARLLADLIGVLHAQEAADLAEEVVPRLEAMGAIASAAQARAALATA